MNYCLPDKQDRQPPPGLRIGKGTGLRLLFLGMALVAIIAACGSSTEDKPADDERIAEMERRVAELEQQHIELPPDPVSQIGLSRTWIPKAFFRESFQAVVERSGDQVGFHQPIANAHATRFSADGISYERWDGEIQVGPAPCGHIQIFMAQLEAQPEWPTLVLDDFEIVGYIDSIPAKGNIKFHITVREADSPAENEEEYRSLTPGRGTFAISRFSCEPRTPAELTRGRIPAELENLQAAVTAAMSDNKVTRITPVAATNDMSMFQDTTTAVGVTSVAAGSIPGLRLYNHDSDQSNATNGPQIRYTTSKTTECKYLAQADGTVEFASRADNAIGTLDPAQADCGS